MTPRPCCEPFLCPPDDELGPLWDPDTEDDQGIEPMSETATNTRCADCRDGKLGDRFTLAIEEGGMYLSCSACGSLPDWLDQMDSVYFDMQPIPVSVTFEADHPDLGGWHGDVRCDCNWWYAITPVRPVAAEED